MKTYSQDEYIGLDQDVLKTSSEDEDGKRHQDVLKRLHQDKSLVGLGLTAAASATDAAIYKKMFGSGHSRMLALRHLDFTCYDIINFEWGNELYHENS